MLKSLYLSFSVLFLVGIISPVLAEEYTFSGVYLGKNIYVQNPLTNEQDDFCTKAVYVNDLLVVNNPKTSAYEIDLSYLLINEPVIIKIIHGESCKPKVINPQVIRPKNQFQFLSVYVDSNEVRWITQSELNEGKYFLEQYMNGKWVIVEILDAKGEETTNQYQIAPKHNLGLNRYRIKYVSGDDVFFSQAQQFFAEITPVEVLPDTAKEKILLSRETDYELLDAEGNPVAKGKGKEIDLVNLSAGLYYLNIENRTEKIVKE